MRPSGHLRTLVTAGALAAAVTIGVPSAAAQPQIGGFSAVPASASTSASGAGAYFREKVSPNQTVTDEARVSNTSDTPVRLLVYPVDGLTGVTSGAVYGNDGQPLRKAGRWLRSSARVVTLSPGTQRLVSFTVHVPPGTAAGDHLAGLAFEDAHHTRSGGRFAIVQIVRVVVGVEIEVPGSAKAQIKLLGLGLKALPGTQVPAVTVRLVDAGGRLCKPALAVSLAGASGRQPAVFHKLDTILPGDAIPFPLPWPRPLRSGTYAMTAVASQCGNRVSLHAIGHLGASLNGTTAQPYARTANHAGGTPWWVFALVGFGAFSLGLFISRRRQPVPGRAWA